MNYYCEFCSVEYEEDRGTHETCAESARQALVNAHNKTELAGMVLGLRAKLRGQERQPREFTKEEARAHLLEHIRGLVQYWANESRAVGDENKLDGLAFSILSALDGSSGNLCGLLVIPCPAPEDKEYHIDNGENYYADPPAEALSADIGDGCLHEEYSNKRKPL